MKKIVYTLTTLCLGIVIGMTSTAAAGPVKQYVQASFEKIIFVVNGEEKPLDADPLVYQGTTYLPVRTVLNTLGYDVGYKADTKTVTADKSSEVDPSEVEPTEIDIPNQKEGDKVPVVNTEKSIEEQINELTDYLKWKKESLDNYELMVKNINERTDISAEEKERAINLRKPLIESTKKAIEETEAKISELQK